MGRVIREFKAAPGAGFHDEEAQRIGDFLEEKLGLASRPVEAEEIVKAARPKRSPIHRYFEWDDSRAAHEYRLSQARHLVRHIVVSHETDDGKQMKTRAFHHVRLEGECELSRGYVAERVIWRNPDMAQHVIAKAMHELSIWRQRYAQYSELSMAVAKVDEALREAA